MSQIIRVSVPEDVPAQRELWRLAFGDDGAYVDNFYTTYYHPDRFLVLEEGGLVRSMTAWFDTTFIVPGMGEYRAAYLYAVATHPDCRGRGLAGELLAWADGYFRSLGIPAVTTVPAEPSLHNFFGANGFRECFTMEEKAVSPAEFPVSPAGTAWVPLSPAEYGRLREELLADIPHIAYPEDALAYQAGCCRVSGEGGLFRVDTPAGPAALCAEMGADGLCVVKELLGEAEARRLAARDLPRAVPAERWLVRGPRLKEEAPSRIGRFAMLKWLDEGVNSRWNWSSSAYLGLAFD